MPSIEFVRIEINGIPLSLLIAVLMGPAMWTFFYFYIRVQNRKTYENIRALLLNIGMLQDVLDMQKSDHNVEKKNPEEV